MYSEKVRQLVSELPNGGELAAATHSARVENPVCGDIIQLFFRVEDGTVEACRFKAQGCAAAIASAAAVTLLCHGRELSDCRQLQSRDILQYLGGLPAHKKHGAELAAEGLQLALAEPRI